MPFSLISYCVPPGPQQSPCLGLQFSQCCFWPQKFAHALSFVGNVLSSSLHPLPLVILLYPLDLRSIVLSNEQKRTEKTFQIPVC